MSDPKPRILPLILVNLVLTLAVVGVAFGVMEWDDGPAMPAASAGAAEVQELRAEVNALRERLEELQALDLLVKEHANRIAEIEARPAALPGASQLPGGTEVAEAAAAPKAPSPEEQMLKGFQAMMKAQMKRGRDRFLRDIMEPTEASENRARRQIEWGVRRVKEALDLDERDTAEVSRILTTVDTRRRERLRELVRSKNSPDDIEYEEIKTVLDDSFEQEDEMIRRSLPPEKAKEYEENAEPIRNFFYGAAKLAFPSKEEESAEK